MNTPGTEHPLVRRYLAALERLLSDFDPVERAEITEGVRDHLCDEMSDGDDGSVDAALRRLGPVEAIAEEAMRGRSTTVVPPVVRPPVLSRPWVPVAVVALQALSFAIVLLASLAAPGVVVTESSVSGGGTTTVTRDVVFDAGESVDFMLAAVLGTIPWWPVVGVLVGSSPLWTAWEWIRIVSAVPVVGLLLALFPVVGWSLGGQDGMAVAAYASLVVCAPIVAHAVWLLPRRATTRARVLARPR